MTKTAARGMKRWCQDEACGLPFYDLNRTDIACPNCGAVYKVVAVEPVAAPRERYARRLENVPTRAPVDVEAEQPAEVVADTEDEPETEEDAGLNEVLLEPEDDEADDVAVVPRGKGDTVE